MTLYIAQNGAMQTAAALVPTATGTAIKTHLQISSPTTQKLSIVEWGISFDGFAAALPIRCELIDTAAVAATVTAHVAAGVQPYNDSSVPASGVTLGVGNTGYNASAEGTVTASRIFDVQFIAPTNQYIKQWPLGREPDLAISRFLRIRTTSAASVNCYCYIVWEE